MTSIADFALENLPGTIHEPDLFDRFFNLFNERQVKKWQEPSYRSRLLFGGKPLRAEVEGTDLRAQFRHRRGYVLFAGNDYYDEADTYIYFLTSDFQILDEIRVGSAFHTLSGFAVDFEIASENQIDFSIYDDRRTWQLTILDAPRGTSFDAPFGETSRPLKRLFAKQYLKLETK